MRDPECHLLEVLFCFRVNKEVMPTNTTLHIWNKDGSMFIYDLRIDATSFIYGDGVHELMELNEDG
jgi:hypothetical protein